MGRSREVVQPPKAVRVFEEIGNKVWPLPHDYDELTGGGQREARQNLIFTVGDKQATPELFVGAWEFFRGYYLGGRAGWYKPPVFPSPPIHYQMIYDWALWPRNLYGVPRSFAKTTLILEFGLLNLMGRWGFDFLLIKSRERQGKADMGRVRAQIGQNPFILEDFGTLEPVRGKGAWSNERFELNNRSVMTMGAVKGQSLGWRPTLVALDDVEFDPVMNMVQNHLTEEMENFFMNHVEPMLDEGCAAILSGTLHTRRQFLYRFGMVPEEEDRRVRYWNRVIMGAKTDEGELVWGTKFSEQVLQEKRERMGDSAWAAQCMNRPGSDQERALPLHENLNWYEIEEDGEDLFVETPFSSEATFRIWKPTNDPNVPWEAMDRKAREVVQGCRRLILVDYSLGESSVSDYSCVAVIGSEHNQEVRDTVFVLDLFLGRVGDAQLSKEIWERVWLWRPQVVAVESIGMSSRFAEEVRVKALDFEAAGHHPPRVIKLQYEGELKKSKGERILKSQWRFPQGKIKLPRHVRAMWPWRELVKQIEDFTPDLGLLAYDDAVDTVCGMTPYVVRAKGRVQRADEPISQKVAEMYTAGVRYIPGTRIRVKDCLSPQVMTKEAMDKLRWERMGKRMEEGKRRKYRRHRE